MGKCYVLSRCIKVTFGIGAEFHFKGVLRGYSINTIQVGGDLGFEVGHDYLLEIMITEIKDGTLFAKVVRRKDLDKFA